jgi:Holliday junction resolvase RusA-like endonuclease
MIVIELAGEPMGKERPRKGKNGHFYTPAKTRAYEASLQWAARLEMKSKKPLSGAVKASVTAILPVPVSWPAEKRAEALLGLLRPTGRPDGDNLIKAAFDALNGLVWNDDAQVVEARVSKVYGKNPGIRIEVAAI